MPWRTSGLDSVRRAQSWTFPKCPAFEPVSSTSNAGRRKVPIDSARRCSSARARGTASSSPGRGSRATRRSSSASATGSRADSRHRRRVWFRCSLPPQARLIAAGYLDRPGLPGDWHVEAGDCRCMACAGWPASAHVESEDLLCMCDACQEEFDPPEYCQWLRIAESRRQVLGWSCKPPAPPGIAPWLFGFASSAS